MVPRQLMNFIEHDIALMASWIERAGYGADLKSLKILKLSGKQVSVPSKSSRELHNQKNDRTAAIYETLLAAKFNS